MIESKWYVLQVIAGLELEVAKRLNSRGFSTAIPLENRVIRRGGKWTTQQYIVFDGYVFVRMNYSWNKYYAMSGINGIIRILGGGVEPIALSDTEVEFVSALSDLLATPSVVKFDGDKYEPVCGFLAEYKDKIVKIQRRYKRATVNITVAGEDKEITVSFTEQMPEQSED